MTPSVGIFWFVRERNRDDVLVADCTPLTQAERYGECLTHATGHAEFWDGLVALGPTGLRARGLPPTIAMHEYEDFPRGRVVYWVPQERFVIYADRRIQGAEFIAQVANRFALPEGQYTVESDLHYAPVG